MKLPDISTPDGRRSWAFLALTGAAMVFTVFAAVGVYLVASIPGLSFWLALAAHVQVFAVISGLGALFVKRSYKVGRDGLSIDDKSDTL